MLLSIRLLLLYSVSAAILLLSSSVSSSVGSSGLGNNGGVPIAVLDFEQPAEHIAVLDQIHPVLDNNRLNEVHYNGMPVHEVTQTHYLYDFEQFGDPLAAATATTTIFSTSTSVLIHEWNEYTTTLRRHHHHRSSCTDPPFIPPFAPPFAPHLFPYFAYS